MPAERQDREYYPRRERRAESPAYTRCCRFSNEDSAGSAYLETQRLLHATPQSDLSTFRLMLIGVWHVAVLGQEPPSDFREQIESVLATGEEVVLPDEVLRVLAARRADAIRTAPWVERHFRPGKPLRPQ